MDDNVRKNKRLLIVDDEYDLLILLKKVLSKKCDCDISLAETGLNAQHLVTTWNPSVVLTDIIMPEGDGLQLLNFIQETDPTISTIIMTGYGTVEMAVNALKNGAYDFFEKPFDNDKISRVVKRAFERTRLIRENQRLQQEVFNNCRSAEFIGEAPPLRHAIDLLTRFGQSDATVLIRGESGTGKEIAARTIHLASKRANKKMIIVNCPALPEQILESELFGYCKGAFTGADHNKDGLFLEAEGSTILLDEIADIPVTLQTKLLRVLQEKEIQPLGQTKTQKIDVRVLASTNQNLEEKITKGEFREDLYYRLNVMSVVLPPLAELKEDIPLLAYHFLKVYEAEYERKNMSLSPEALQYLLNRTWKGNVREFQNCINRAVLLAPDQILKPEDFAENDVNSKKTSLSNCVTSLAYLDNMTYKKAKQVLVSEFTISYLSKMLLKNNGNVSSAAKESGMERQALQRLMRKHSLQSNTFR
ncbi:MAG: sigma-54-dependent Fis family transcriptional regulator [Desulfocapsa sp.]|nr:sigma-54-dependent Fis family transcriptional regulator [Desulfocapsa sp.]